MEGECKFFAQICSCCFQLHFKFVIFFLLCLFFAFARYNLRQIVNECNLNIYIDNYLLFIQNQREVKRKKRTDWTFAQRIDVKMSRNWYENSEHVWRCISTEYYVALTSTKIHRKSPVFSFLSIHWHTYTRTHAMAYERTSRRQLKSVWKLRERAWFRTIWSTRTFRFGGMLIWYTNWKCMHIHTYYDYLRMRVLTACTYDRSIFMHAFHKSNTSILNAKHANRIRSIRSIRSIELKCKPTEWTDL